MSCSVQSVHSVKHVANVVQLAIVSLVELLSDEETSTHLIHAVNRLKGPFLDLAGYCQQESKVD